MLEIVVGLLLVVLLFAALLLCALVGWLLAESIRLSRVMDMDNAKLRGQADALQARLESAETELAWLTKEKAERDDGEGWRQGMPSR